MYGFGAKVDGTVRHCFPLTFNESQPEVHGVDGILAAYHASFPRLLLSGPTVLLPISSLLHHCMSLSLRVYNG